MAILSLRLLWNIPVAEERHIVGSLPHKGKNRTYFESLVICTECFHVTEGTTSPCASHFEAKQKQKMLRCFKVFWKFSIKQILK